MRGGEHAESRRNHDETVKNPSIRVTVRSDGQNDAALCERRPQYMTLIDAPSSVTAKATATPTIPATRGRRALRVLFATMAGTMIVVAEATQPLAAVGATTQMGVAQQSATATPLKSSSTSSSSSSGSSSSGSSSSGSSSSGSSSSGSSSSGSSSSRSSSSGSSYVSSTSTSIPGGTQSTGANGSSLSLGDGSSSDADASGASAIAKNSLTNASTTKLSASKSSASLKSFGGRVKQDAFGRWIVDGEIVGLGTVNLLPGQDAIFETTLPAGLTPVEFRGRFVPSVGSPVLEIGLTGSPVTQMRPGSFVLPTRPSATTAKNALAFTDGSYLEFTARSKDLGPCLELQPAQIDSVQVISSGTAIAPDTLADFFPPYLDRLVLRLPSGMSADVDERVAQAVLNLTTFAAQRWPAARVVVTDKDVAMTPYDRQISFAEATNGSVALAQANKGVTELLISGPTKKLPDLADVVSSPTFEAAFVRSLTTDGQRYIRPELSDTVTIGDLRGRALLATGYGTVEQVVTISQSQFGGQSSSIDIKITGVAQAEGSNEVILQLRANDQVLDSKKASNDEPFELKGTVSRSTLARDNIIIVRATETGALARQNTVKKVTANGSVVDCVQGRPEVTLRLDPGSVFHATLGRGLPAGFDRFPQAFVPGFDVRFTSLTIDDLKAAEDVLRMLQNLSAPRLLPTVIGPDRSHSSNRPMLYVGQTTSELEALNAPIIPARRSQKNSFPVSVLQGFAATGDDHLVLVTNGPSSALSSTLKTVIDDVRGWRSLKGDVVVQQNGRVRNLRVRPSLGTGEERARELHRSRIWRALALGLAVGLGSAVVLGMVAVVREKRS